MKFGAIGRTKMLFETINCLLENKHELAFIITSKASPEYEITELDFEKLAIKHNVPYICTSNLNKIDNLPFAEIVVSVNFTTVIKNNFIKKFPLGILNAHCGDLPKYRGNAPVAWAIINKEKEIGLCVHKMEGGSLDSGDIISKVFFQLSIDTKISEVFNWMNKEIPLLFNKSLNLLTEGSNFIPENQDDRIDEAFRCFPRTPEDGKIDWNLKAKDLLRLINVSSEPFSGAFCFYNNEKLIVWDAKLFTPDFNYKSTTGQIYISNQKVYVITKKGMIELVDISYGTYRGPAINVIKSIRTRLL
jgi:UDP-4-amino-4-deoxy-L-arabinose formyltransferase/UDP-glucuronic acid dehydrogenase (UDP-4-keto-hexauronic acid decarboxylating)